MIKYLLNSQKWLHDISEVVQLCHRSKHNGGLPADKCEGISIVDSILELLNIKYCAFAHNINRIFRTITLRLRRNLEHT